jgi:large subunit ribosomal protein L9
MEIILLQDVNKLGQKDDIINVKDGYGTNFLIPKGYAVAATPSAKKVHAENLKQRAHKEEKIKVEAQAVAAKLAEINLVVGAKTSSSGKIFGSVNTIQIAEALKEKGLKSIVRASPCPKIRSRKSASTKLLSSCTGKLKFKLTLR